MPSCSRYHAAAVLLALPSLSSLLAGLTHLPPILAYLVVFTLVALEYLGVPSPGETALIVASLYAAATGDLAIGWVVTVAAAAAIVGATAGFALGYWAGAPLLVRFGPRLGLDERRHKIGRYVFLRHGAKVVFFGRFLIVLRTYLAFLAGLSRMRWSQFGVYNVAGAIVWAAGWGLGCYELGSVTQRVGRVVDIALIAVAAVVIAATIVFLRRNETRLAAEAERALPGPLDGSPR
jgi:membrane protein DedA with SNARE-associated domain